MEGVVIHKNSKLNLQTFRRYKAQNHNRITQECVTVNANRINWRTNEDVEMTNKANKGWGWRGKLFIPQLGTQIRTVHVRTKSVLTFLNIYSFRLYIPKLFS